jgi:hypothetical protein
MSVFDAAVPIYVALMLGPLVAAVPAVWTLATLGRFGRATLAVVVGVVGSVGATMLLLTLVAQNVPITLAVLAAQLLAVGVGAGLYALQRAPVTGHVALSGTLLPTQYVILAAFATQFAPGAVLLALRHPLLAMLDGAS